jgi:Cof subfamily protein (haloacid dehalogenase superfamily)
MKALYISDLDGTLLNPEAKVSEFTVKTLNSLIEKGLNFTFATARSLQTSLKIAHDINIKIPAVVNNGTFIEDPVTGKIIVSNEFTKEEQENAVKIFSENEIYPFVYSFIDKRRMTSWLYNKTNMGMEVYIDSHKNDDRLRAAKTQKELYFGRAYYFSAIGEKSKLEPIYKIFLKDGRYNLNFQKEIYRDEYWLEVMPKAATKAEGIKVLKKLYNFDRIISFGDSFNDLQMFKVSDKCFAVENAFEEVKRAATAIIGKNSEDGVARFLLQNYK